MRLPKVAHTRVGQIPQEAVDRQIPLAVAVKTQNPAAELARLRYPGSPTTRGPPLKVVSLLR